MAKFTGKIKGEVSDGAVESTTVEGVAAESTAKKGSIVPSRYSGKYKGGGSDALADFIKAQCAGKEGFEFTAFFELCRKNGIADDKVAHYADQVAEKRHGAEGRARMTLRNMLASRVRKDGKLVGLDGTDHELSLPALPKPGTKKEEDHAAEAA